MDRSRRISLRVFVGLEIGCFALLLAGVLMTCSPFWTPGGLWGWWNGYRSNEDVLGIVWLTASIMSIVLGIIASIIAAAMGIWIGIAAGIVGLAGHRTRSEQSQLTTEVNPAEAIDQAGSMEN